ncbi:unnamed protein product, partial [Mesorhabditis spiculigera]
MNMHEAPFGPAGSRLQQYLGGPPAGQARTEGPFQTTNYGQHASNSGLNANVPAFIPRFAQMNFQEPKEQRQPQSSYNPNQPFNLAHEQPTVYQNQQPFYYGDQGSQSDRFDGDSEPQAVIQTSGAFQYNGPPPHIGKFRPRGASGGNNATQFISPELKMELLDRQLVIECKADPAIYPDLPQQIEHMRDLVPLESLPLAPYPPNQVSTVYKVVSVRDGTPYVIRRIYNYRPGPQNAKPLYAADKWKKLVHVNIIQLREVVQTRGFGDNCGARIGQHHPTGPFVSEHTLWNYIVQITSALRVIHAAGLAARCLSLEKVLLHGSSKILLSSCGVQDVLNGEVATIQQAQNSDYNAIGRLILSLCVGKLNLNNQNMQHAMNHVAHHYSNDMQKFLGFMFSIDQTSRPSVIDIMPFVGARFYGQLDNAQIRVDILENELSKELENGRLFRLICKLNTIIERPEAEWTENGDRFLLRLFRDYVFHQVTDTGKPWMDLAHVVHTLNKLDAGISEKISLVSRDGENVLIVSYADLKHCMQQAFNELATASGRS